MGTSFSKATDKNQQSSAVANTPQASPQANTFVDNRTEATQLKSQQDTAAGSTPPAQLKENNTGLPDKLKTGMENLSGLSMDDVKVHRNSHKPAQLQAHAYAQGTDIHLGPGQEKHLPHELGHVVQQKQGRVKPTIQMKGKVNVNDDGGLEKEADLMGVKALQTEGSDKQQVNSSVHQLVLQMEEIDTAPTAEDKEFDVVATASKEDDAEVSEEEQKEKSEISEAEEVSLTEKVTMGKSIVDSIKGLKGSLDKKPSDVGESLVSKSTGLMGKLGGALNIISFLGNPVKNMATALLGLKTKWGQWNVYNSAADNGVPEAIYGLGKIMKGFASGLSKFLWNAFVLVTRILFFIPAATAVAASIIVFQGVAEAFKSLASTTKGIWQRLKGEKKDKFSKQLLERAINGDNDALQLIFDLKLSSITGSDFWIVNKATILKNELTSKDNILSHSPDAIKDNVPSLIHKGPIDRRELIFNSEQGPPQSPKDLQERLEAIKESDNSKSVIIGEIKATMTGMGT
jgi:hypothetical protein